MQQFDVIVIGQGYAGLKAAQLAAERGLRTATVETMFPGGLVTSINELHPAPEGEEPSGPELTAGLAMANMDAGVENVSGAATSLARGIGDLWQVEAEGEFYAAPKIVVASGARLRKLGVPGEEELAGRGVSECADCDGPLYQGKEAVVIGGGDSAFQEALALTAYASKVTIVMRGAASRARPERVDAVAQHGQIEVLAHSEVTAILGDSGSGVTGVRLSHDGAETELACSVVFVFVGLKPDADYLPAEIERDAAGAVVVSEGLETSAAGVWAVGAVRSGFGGWLSHAAEDVRRVVAAF